MRINAIKSRVIRPPRDTLDDLWQDIAPRLTERCIVAVTSKVIAIAEGRCQLINQEPKDDLIKREADQWLSRDQVPGNWVMHAMKNGILAASCGIDESNCNGYYVYWPADSTASALQIWERLKTKTQVKNFGVVITDSRSTPLRRGVTGFALAFYGFAPLIDYRGQEDLFGHQLRVSQSNIPDAIATAATLVMGEGAEAQPAALISELPSTIQFIEGKGEEGGDSSTLIVPLEEDLYRPFIINVPWEPGGKA